MIQPIHLCAFKEQKQQKNKRKNRKKQKRGRRRSIMSNAISIISKAHVWGQLSMSVVHWEFTTSDEYLLSIASCVVLGTIFVPHTNTEKIEIIFCNGKSFFSVFRSAFFQYEWNSHLQLLSSYVVFGVKWGISIFQNGYVAERNHFSLVYLAFHPWKYRTVSIEEHRPNSKMINVMIFSLSLKLSVVLDSLNLGH